MQFFCTKDEFDSYAKRMGLDMSTVIKADIHRAIAEAKATFML